MYFFLYGTAPLYYEACAEVTYPAPEGNIYVTLLLVTDPGFGRGSDFHVKKAILSILNIVIQGHVLHHFVKDISISKASTR